MSGSFYLWSKTASTNASIDPSINLVEGMAPSAVNDSARAIMAAAASYRDDTNGSLVVGGTSTAYTITTNQAFASVADLDGQEITFGITPTCGAAATLNVNGIGAFPLVFSSGNAMPAGSLVDGSVYSATFSNALSCWKVRSYFGSVFGIPLGGMMDYICPAVPNANFVFPIGQAISRATYAALFALVGTTYGVGDGVTTFNIPDLTGRVAAMKEAAATRLTASFFGGNSTVLGAVGGLESTTLTALQIPSITSRNAAQAISVVSNLSLVDATGVLLDFNPPGAAGFRTVNNTASLRVQTSTGNNDINVTSNNTSGNAHRTVPPTIIVNKILRII